MQDSIQNPVEMVSWDDCQQFIAKLNARVPGGNFLFPSEAQWEGISFSVGPRSAICARRTSE